MKIRTKFMLPIILMFITGNIILAIYTGVRESFQHISREQEAWIDVGNSLVRSWMSTMLFTGSDNLARDQFYQGLIDFEISRKVARNPKLIRINPESSPYITTDLEKQVIANGKPISNVIDTESERNLLTLVPIKTKDECIRCHLEENGHDLQVGEVMAVVTIISSLEHVDKEIASDVYIVLAAATIGIILGTLFIYGFTTKLTNPINTLVEKAKLLAAGDLNIRSEIRRDDELGKLAGAFDNMTEKLRESHSKLEEYSKNLERIVEEKVKEVKKSEIVFQRLMKGTLAETGKQYFENLVLNIADWLDSRWCIVGELINDNQVRTLAWSADGKIQDPFEYKLKHTPCEKVVKKNFCLYSKDINSLFPKDKLLLELGAEAYIGIPLRNPNGNVMGILCAINDKPLRAPAFIKEVLSVFAQRATTELERSRITKEIRSSEKKYRTIFEQSKDAIYISNLEGKLVDANQVLVDLFGYTREETIGLKAKKIYANPKDRRKFLKEIKRNGSVKDFEVKLRKKDGTEMICLVNSIIRRDVNGKILGYQGVIRDITDRRQAEKLQASTYKISESVQTTENLEELFRSIHEIIGELMPAKNFYIALYDADNKMLSFPYFMDEHDEPPVPHRLGKGLTEYVIRKGRPLLASPEVFPELVDKGEIELIGEPSIDWLGVPLKVENETIGVLVTQSYTEGVRYTEEHKNIFKFVSTQIAMAIQRKQAEGELRNSEERYRSTISSMNDLIFSIDNEGYFREYYRPSDSKVYDPPDKFLNKNYKNVLPPNVAEALSDALEGISWGHQKREYEYSINIHGEEYWFNTVVTGRYNENGEFVGATAVVRDITERQRAENELRYSYQLQDVLNSLVHISLENIHLQELLERAIDTIISVPFMPTIPKGGIFLIENEPELLVLKAQRGFQEALQNKCAKIPFGECYCGKAAISKKIEFVGQLDNHHEYQYEGIIPHGHYNVPILSKGEILGVIVIFLHEGHTREEREVNYLQAVADTMAGIIERKQAEEDLKKTLEELERFNRLAVGRELKMIELKKELNELLSSSGLPEKYKIHSLEVN